MFKRSFVGLVTIAILVGACGDDCGTGSCASTPPSSSTPRSCDLVSCSDIGATCGTQSDGCGDTIQCGTCSSGEACSSGQCLPPGSKEFYATRTSCTRPCAIQFDAQFTENLSWPEVRDSVFIWDFDDGGLTGDSRGFLAANVFEEAGTYNVTLTVNGAPWQIKTITVREPSAVGCVSPTSDWTNCPDATNRYTTISAATSALGTNNVHILLEGGRAFTMGDYPSSTNLTFGAYDNGGSNPAVTMSSEFTPGDYTTLQDLDITHSHGGTQFGPNGKEGFLLHRTASTGSGNCMFANNLNGGAFVMDSSLENTGTDYCVYLSRGGGANDSKRMVFKGSTINRNHSNRYWSMRSQGPDRMLVQDSKILVGGNEANYGSFTIRGDTKWHLVQGNYFNSATTTQPQSTSFDETIQNIVWERNVHDPRTSGHRYGLNIVATDSVYRNNVVIDWAYVGIRVEDYPSNDSSGIEIYNNTVMANSTGGGNTSIVCNSTNACIIRNNIVYSISSPLGCISAGGSTLDKNWCYVTKNTGACLLPDGSSGPSACTDPNFAETTCGRSGEVSCTNTDFVRPASATPGINAGDDSVPVFVDLFDRPRTDIDVGAVE